MAKHVGMMSTYVEISLLYFRFSGFPLFFFFLHLKLPGGVNRNHVGSFVEKSITRRFLVDLTFSFRVSPLVVKVWKRGLRTLSKRVLSAYEWQLATSFLMLP